jgi:hypothetical protein
MLWSAGLRHRVIRTVGANFSENRSASIDREYGGSMFIRNGRTRLPDQAMSEPNMNRHRCEKRASCTL